MTPRVAVSAARAERASPGAATTFALYAGTVAVYADMYLTQPVLPLLSREFGLTPARAGLSVSAVVISIAAASGFHGPLSDALGRKRVMVSSVFLLAIPTLLCAFTSAFPPLLALRALQGLLIPGMTAVSVAFVGDTYAPRDLARAVGGLIGASVVGGLIGRVGSGLVASVAGWRAGFVLFSAVTLVAAALMARALPSHAGGERVRWGRAYRGMLAHLADRRLAGAFLIGASLFFSFIGIFTFLPYELSGPPFHLSTRLVSSVYVVYLAGAIVSPVAGRLASRLSPRLLIGGGLVVAALGIAGTLAGSLAAIITGLVVLCVGMFTAQAVAPGFVNATARAAKGGAGALYLAFYYLGGTLGSSLPGLAWQGFGWRGVVASCLAALSVAFLSNVILCRPQNGSPNET